MRTAAYNVDVAMRPPQAPEFAVQTLCLIFDLVEYLFFTL